MHFREIERSTTNQILSLLRSLPEDFPCQTPKYESDVFLSQSALAPLQTGMFPGSSRNVASIEQANRVGMRGEKVSDQIECNAIQPQHNRSKRTLSRPSNNQIRPQDWKLPQQKCSQKHAFADIIPYQPYARMLRARQYPIGETSAPKSFDTLT